MRLLYVVQRYGAEIAGGAEQHCREFAERLAGRGHDVEVATSCAQSYADWSDRFPAGSGTVDGVGVHRFPGAGTRDRAAFDELTLELTQPSTFRPAEVARDWIERQGPVLPALAPWLRRNATRFDCVIFFTYLYWPTWAGLRAIAGAVPTVLHPTVHDEPALWFPVYDELFRLPDALALSAPEEAELIESRFGFEPAGAVIGIGTEVASGDPHAFRAAHPELGDDPYLCFVGRIDAGKGARELLEHFAAYKDRRTTNVRLVFVGEPQFELPARDDILATGFVDAQTRDAAMSGALAIVQPSHYESFSMVVVEALALGRPVLVQRKCAVTRGHVERSGAGLAYEDAGDFATAVDRLVQDASWVTDLGTRGRDYADREYAWDVVLDRYERMLSEVVPAR